MNTETEVVEKKDEISEILSKGVENRPAFDESRLPNPQGLSKLTNKERRLWNLIKSQSGVVFLTGSPGTAKSAIGKTIATKLGMRFFYFPLSQVDEVDLGCWPTKEEQNDPTSPTGKRQVQTTVVPKWALEANEYPTLIMFEELNRASLQVRNASLQILNERGIGYTGFHFNENVFMMAAGNLGDADNTDVEDLDAAMNTRLIHVQHTLTLDEWIEGFAEENVHGSILAFLRSEPSFFNNYADAKNNVKVYGCARTWTNLSEAIFANYGGHVNMSELSHFVAEYGAAFVGVSATEKFKTFLTTSVQYSYVDILNNFKRVESELKNDKINRSVIENINYNLRGALIDSANPHSFDKLNEDQFQNLVSYMTMIDADASASMIRSFVGYISKLNGPHGKPDKNSMIVKRLAYIANHPKLKEYFQHYKKTSSIKK